MGMSSSQARLLTLTARQHDVELRAQKLQADKLRMANDSDKVYNTYLEALSATKIQARVYDKWEADTFKDATLAMMEHGVLNNPAGDVAAVPLFLQETGHDGSTCILVTEEIKNKYDITESMTPWTGTMDDFFYAEGLTDANHKKVIGTHKEPDPTKTVETGNYLSFPATANDTTNTFSRTLLTSGVVANGAGDNTDTTVYDNFQNEITKTDTSAMQDINSVSTLSTGQSYKITDAAGLQKLQTLSSSTSGVTIYLANTIEMSSESGWSGISNFAGTFDGNGYTINNLTGSSGLFEQASGTIKNIGLTNINISGSDIGGICGTLNSGGVIENCYVTGNISSTNHAGGIVGTINNGAVKNSNVNVDISTTAGQCYGGISGHNSGAIENCNATGTISGAGYWVGGLVGHNTGTTNIIGCKTTVEASSTDTVYKAGSVIGYDNGSSLAIQDVTYKEGDINPICGNKDSDEYGTGIFKTQTTIPGIDPADGSGDFATNVLVAMIKSGAVDIYDDAALANLESQVKVYAKALYGTGSNDDLLNIANVNDRIIDYINNGSKYPTTEDEDFIKALQNDVNSSGYPSQTKAAQFQTEYTAAKYNVSVSENTDYNWKSESKGKIKIPTKEVLIKNLKNALTMCKEPTGNAESFINYYFNNPTQENLMTLAYINELIQKYSNDNNYTYEFGELVNATKGTNYSFFSGVPSSPPDLAQYPDRYTIEASIPTLPGEPEKEFIQGTKDVDDYDWNYDHPEVQAVLQKYILRKTGIKVIEPEYANSTNWLTNYINAGLAQFCVFDIDSAFITNDDGTKTLDVGRMTVRGTSVASETSLQEVSDTEFVKRAEADYEASMRKINRKETKIDTELSQLEAERTSIKTEQDGLKKVVDDNVNLTFKLFS